VLVQSHVRRWLVQRRFRAALRLTWLVVNVQVR